MNTNSNTYTVLYSIGLVVVVAAVLAFAAKFLQKKQEENVKKDTISQILTAAGIKYTDDNILDVYKEMCDSSILVDLEGNKVGTLDKASCEVYGNADLKAQVDASNKKLPVYKFSNGVTVVPCYGAGLWGPIWGYIGVNSDLKITKACFGHQGETPGLGAKITDEPDAFANYFSNKTITEKIEVGKGVNPTKSDDINAVDAISGATITSNAAGKMVNQWLGFYQGYFNK